MNDVLVRADAALVSGISNSEFSWPAAIAGAFATSTTIFILLFLGAGVGLSLFTVPTASANASTSVLTFGALYFFFTVAFGAAVGGYLAGRSMGPLFESNHEQHFLSFMEGLTSWTLAVIATATMLAVSGLAIAGPGINGAATLGAATTANSTPSSQQANDTTSGYWTDTLFRPASAAAAPAATQTTPPAGQTGQNDTQAPVAAPGAPTAIGPVAARPINPEVRAEAGRILTIGMASGAMLSQPDHDRLAQLVAQSIGMSMMDASSRVDEVVNRIHDHATQAAETARKGARFISLWLAASLLIGAVTAGASAITGRSIDDRARARA